METQKWDNGAHKPDDRDSQQSRETPVCDNNKANPPGSHGLTQHSVTGVSCLSPMFKASLRFFP